MIGNSNTRNNLSAPRPGVVRTDEKLKLEVTENTSRDTLAIPFYFVVHVIVPPLHLVFASRYV